MNLDNEIWKDVPGYECLYQASNFGNIKVKERLITKSYRGGKLMVQKYEGKTLLASERRGGYRYVHLSINKKTYVVAVHRMVLLAFVGEPEKGHEACHNNGNPRDNSIINLRWDTHLNNNKDKIKHGTYLRGEKHPLSKLTKENIDEIRNSDSTGVSLAKKFSVTTGTISAVKTGRTWKSVS